MNLPSKKQIDDIVILNLYQSGKIESCIVVGVNFTDGKVLYDIAIPINVSNYTTVYNVDSAFVE